MDFFGHGFFLATDDTDAHGLDACGVGDTDGNGLNG